MESEPAFASPKRSATVSLSTSNESRTATRAPFGHAAGWSERPARTVLTTLSTLSMVHCQPGFAVVCGTGCDWATSRDGMRPSARSFMDPGAEDVVRRRHDDAATKRPPPWQEEPRADRAGMRVGVAVRPDTAVYRADPNRLDSRRARQRVHDASHDHRSEDALLETSAVRPCTRPAAGRCRRADLPLRRLRHPQDVAGRYRAVA